jgi:hypothetical protein
MPGVCQIALNSIFGVRFLLPTSSSVARTRMMVGEPADREPRVRSSIVRLGPDKTGTISRTTRLPASDPTARRTPNRVTPPIQMLRVR